MVGRFDAGPSLALARYHVKTRWHVTSTRMQSTLKFFSSSCAVDVSHVSKTSGERSSLRLSSPKLSA